MSRVKRESPDYKSGALTVMLHAWKERGAGNEEQAVWIIGISSTPDFLLTTTGVPLYASSSLIAQRAQGTWNRTLSSKIWSHLPSHLAPPPYMSGNPIGRLHAARRLTLPMTGNVGTELQARIKPENHQAAPSAVRRGPLRVRHRDAGAPPFR